MTNTDTSIAAAKLNPAGTYGDPADVLNDTKMTRDEKIAILREWRYDALRLQESEAENMSGGEPDRLRAVSNALLKLGVSLAKEADPKATPKTSTLSRARRYLTDCMDAIRGVTK